MSLTNALPTGFLSVWLVVASGCASPTYQLEGDALERFKAAGPIPLEVDIEQLAHGLPVPGPYRVVAGDLLDIQGPRTLFSAPTDQPTGQAGASNHLARVEADGNIQVPVAGSVAAAGKTLPEIEKAILEAVYPKFLTARPSIIATVSTYQTVPVTIVGAVQNPGIHELRTDQLTMFGALTAAGGIVGSVNLIAGARVIRVRRPSNPTAPPIVLPVKGLNVPVSNIPLREGDTIEVERFEPDTFTVVGLVSKPGAYSYPPEIRYNLMQVLAIAGGVDRIADPPYATVFRKGSDDTIIPATFAIAGDGMVESSTLEIKPGDVVAVQHTPASWTRSLLAEIVRFQIGVLYDPFNSDN